MSPFPMDNFPDPGGFPDAGGGFAFTLIPVLMTIFFIIFIGLLVFRIAKGTQQWKYNNAQPVLTVEAKLVAKRTNVSTHNHINDDHMHHHHSSTTYFITFEVQSGDRMEFNVASHEYGLLVEGDFGSLTFQGTRYLGFNRFRNQ